MHIYISGGCKNGKSRLAQRQAKALGSPLYYPATTIPADAEDEARFDDGYLAEIRGDARLQR